MSNKDLRKEPEIDNLKLGELQESLQDEKPEDVENLIRESLEPSIAKNR